MNYWKFMLNIRNNCIWAIKFPISRVLNVIFFQVPGIGNVNFVLIILITSMVEDGCWLTDDLVVILVINSNVDNRFYVFSNHLLASASILLGLFKCRPYIVSHEQHMVHWVILITNQLKLAEIHKTQKWSQRHLNIRFEAISGSSAVI